MHPYKRYHQEIVYKHYCLTCMPRTASNPCICRPRKHLVRIIELNYTVVLTNSIIGYTTKNLRYSFWRSFDIAIIRISNWTCTIGKAPIIYLTCISSATQKCWIYTVIIGNLFISEMIKTITHFHNWVYHENKFCLHDTHCLENKQQKPILAQIRSLN